MIEYVEIRDTTRSVIGILDNAKSIIWHSVYYGVGDFEIYAQASKENLTNLVAGNYVTRVDQDEIGIIEQVHIDFTINKGLMVTASGRFAKSILDRRVIYRMSGNSVTPSILSGKVEEAVRELVDENAINPVDTARKMSILQLGSIGGYTDKIIDENGIDTEKQVSCEDLLAYTDGLLQEYEMSAKVILDEETKTLKYLVYRGIDKTASIVFSQEFDNLIESNYEFNRATEKNAALIGGEGEGITRFFSLLTGTKTGFARREVFIEANGINKKYKDNSGIERTYTDEQYKQVLKALGKQTLAQMSWTEQYNGKLDVTNQQWKLYQDFFLGDKVAIQDNNIGKYAPVRIVEILEAQDENGYTVEVIYQ